MIQKLVSDQEAIVAVAKEVIQAAEAEGDDVTVDLAIRRSEVHQKNAWMLRSHLA